MTRPARERSERQLRRCQTRMLGMRVRRKRPDGLDKSAAFCLNGGEEDAMSGEKKSEDKPFKHACVLCLATAFGWLPKCDHTCGYLTIAVARDYNVAELLSEIERINFAQYALWIMGLTPEKIRDYKRRLERMATMDIPPVITGGRRAQSIIGMFGAVGLRSRPPPRRTKG